MPYIEPNSTIQLSKSIDFPMDYSDVAYFESEAEQESYFSTKFDYTLSTQSYQRRGRNRCRLQISMAQAENLCYMRFKNTSFENRWFYAFITSTDYINNSTVEITYSIDVFQTYFCGGRGSLGQCYIARLSTKTDGIGEYIEPERIPLGEFVSNDGEQATLGGTSLLQPAIILAMVPADGAVGGMYDNTYAGIRLFATTGDVAGGKVMNSTIETLQNTADGIDRIVALYMAPNLALPGHTPPSAVGGVASVVGGDTYYNYNNSGSAVTFHRAALTGTEGLDGYVPKNKKLYTYPYNYARVTTGQGNKADYRFEFFENGEPRFYLKANLLPPVAVICAPLQYKNFAHSDDYLSYPYIPEALVLDNYPMCSWNKDTYAAWLAQNSVPMANQRKAWSDKVDVITEGGQVSGIVDTIGGGIKAIAGALTGDILGLAVGAGALANSAVSSIKSINQEYTNMQTSGIDLVTSQLNADYTAAHEANTMGGTIASGSLTLAMPQMDFKYSRWSITASRARAIDDYFTMYGYAYNRITSVANNLHNRQYFTYIQTVDANCISGGGYADTRATIEQAFNKGVRLWWHGNSFRDFSVDNAVLS